MKIYEPIENEFGKFVKAEFDGKMHFIPTDPRNSDYAEYLRYTEWVEAGNNPEDFWTQQDEFEILEDSEPKEEE